MRDHEFAPVPLIVRIAFDEDWQQFYAALHLLARGLTAEIPVGELEPVDDTHGFGVVFRVAVPDRFQDA